MLVLKLTTAIVLLLNHVKGDGQCPPSDETIKKITDFVQPYVVKTICKPGLKPGNCPPKGMKEIYWGLRVLLPKWSKILVRECKEGLPAGWKDEVWKVYHKCHTKARDFCKKVHQEKLQECVQSFVPALMAKFSGVAMRICTCVDENILQKFSEEFKAIAKADIDDYAKAKKGFDC